MTKILDYNKMIDNSEFIDGNQRIIGIFTPVDENYTEFLAKLKVSVNVMERLYPRFYTRRPPEMRLVMNEGKIVGTFEISRWLHTECKPCMASPAA